MKLKEFNFNKLQVPGLAIYVNDKNVLNGFIGEVLKKASEYTDYEIKSTNYYFDEFVIRL